MKKHLMTLSTMIYRNQHSGETPLRIWDDLVCEYDTVWEGMLEDAPKKYLHKPIAEWYPSADGIVVFY